MNPVDQFTPQEPILFNPIDLLSPEYIAQSSTELRTYEDKQQKPENEKRISFTEVSNRERILEQRGSIDTLAVYVRYRQSATWQGSVYHMKNNEREDFNSELDLLKIIENCQNSTKNVAESG